MVYIFRKVDFKKGIRVYIHAYACLCDNSCYGGFSGRQCEVVQCDVVNDCSGHGHCYEPNVCLCDDGFTGTSCSQYKCDDVNYCSGKRPIPESLLIELQIIAT